MLKLSSLLQNDAITVYLSRCLRGRLGWIYVTASQEFFYPRL